MHNNNPAIELLEGMDKMATFEGTANRLHQYICDTRLENTQTKQKRLL
jgi:hypothetical protein